NNGGTLDDALTWDAFGNLVSESNAPNGDRYGYTGRERDLETGLQYNRARWYDPASGRWMSEDPLGFDAGDSNLYRDVNNIPTGGTDSSGLQEGLQLPPIDATRNRRVTLFVPSMAFSKEIFIGKGQNATDIINLNIQAYAKGKAFKIFYSDQEITKFYNQAI